MARAFIAIGSNIAPAENVRAALHALARQTHLVAISTVYRTDALDRPEQAAYYNCVAQIETELPPLEVKRAVLRPIEDRLGRRRSDDRYAARTIDLDLIIYGDLQLDTGELTLPDPDILTRPFLAIPLSELAPNLVLPGRHARISDIASGLPGDGMQPLMDYGRGLAEEFRRGG